MPPPTSHTSIASSISNISGGVPLLFFISPSKYQILYNEKMHFIRKEEKKGDRKRGRKGRRGEAKRKEKKKRKKNPLSQMKNADGLLVLLLLNTSFHFTSYWISSPF